LLFLFICIYILYFSIGNEIRAINAIVDKNISGLCVTLTLLVRYRGHAIIALALCPINSTSSEANGTGDTLEYGSCDGGITVLNSNPKVDKLMKQLGEDLNLKEHIVVGDDEKEVPS